MILPQTWIENWAEISSQLEEGAETTAVSQDDHKTSSTEPQAAPAVLEGINETNKEQVSSSKEQASPSSNKEDGKNKIQAQQSSSDYKPLTIRSQSFDDILSNVKVISPTSTAPPTTIPFLAVTVNNDSTNTFVSMDGDGSRSDSEEVEHLGLQVWGVTSSHSDSRLAFQEESVPKDGDGDTHSLNPEPKNGNLKRSSSDTLISSGHQSGEGELLGRFTKFTSRLFGTIAGKSSKLGSSSQLSSKANSEANDSDTSTSSQFRSQVSQKLHAVRQKFKGYSTSMPRFKVGVGWSRSPQTEPTEDEAKKQEKRARSKSKILIV